MPSRRVLRLVTALLLAGIALDLAVIHTCALDADAAPASALATVTASGTQGAPAHSPTALHPDHCFCCGLSTGADWSAAPGHPLRRSEAVPDPPAGPLLRISAALYHPPQLHS